MARKRPKTIDKSSREWKLTEHLTRFVNEVFGRRLRPSRAVFDAVVDALDAGYDADELRIAFWAARCLKGEWIGSELQSSLPAHVVLRFHGGMNTTTGKPAVRWLDDLSSRAPEMNSRLVGIVLDTLPEDMRESERELLKRQGVTIETR